jgi:hypothetical protein
MTQNDKTAQETTEAGTGSLADQYLADIETYKQAIHAISDIFHKRDSHLIYILSDPEKLKICETQIQDVWNNITNNLGEAPHDISFRNKSAVLQHLSDARIELTKVLFLLRLDPLVAVKGFDYLDPFLEHLDLAESLMFIMKDEEEN